MTTDTHHHKPDDKETTRIEAFSDGIFAVAVTLLAFDLRVPDVGMDASGTELTRAMLGLWPSYLAFVSSFASILIMWINHHGIVRMLRRADTAFMFTNGFLLLLVSATPFPTALIARYLQAEAGQTAAAIYGGFYLAINIAFILLWHSICYRRRLLRDEIPDSVVNSITRRIYLGFPLYLAATLASLISVWLSVGIILFLWVFWSFMAYYSQQNNVSH